MASLEHLNVTVKDPHATAKVLHDLFGWHVRWEGEAISGGYTVHVGSDDTYLALYTPNKKLKDNGHTYTQSGGLNHIGVVVDDLDAVEEQVKVAGFKPVNHADYEPGRRFYFYDHNNLEIEVVSYQK